MVSQQTLVSVSNHIFHDETKDGSEGANSLRRKLTAFFEHLGVCLLELCLQTHSHIACDKNDWHDGEEGHQSKLPTIDERDDQRPNQVDNCNECNRHLSRHKLTELHDIGAQARGKGSWAVPLVVKPGDAFPHHVV